MVRDLVYTGHLGKHLYRERASISNLFSNFHIFQIFNPVEQLSTGIWSIKILLESNDFDTHRTTKKWNPFSQDTLVKIRAEDVNHAKAASLTHSGCTRSIEQMRKNANFPMKIGAIKACITLENDSLAHREWRFLSTSGIEGFRKKPETQLTRKGCGR